jgi:hypothetical protein
MKKIKIITFALLLGIFGSKDIMHCQLSVTNPTQETQDLLSHIESYLEQIEQGMNQVNQLKEAVFSSKTLESMKKITGTVKMVKEWRDNISIIVKDLQYITDRTQYLIKSLKSMNNSVIMYDNVYYTNELQRDWSRALFPENGIRVSGAYSVKEILTITKQAYSIISDATNLVFKVSALLTNSMDDFQEMTPFERMQQFLHIKKEMNEKKQEIETVIMHKIKNDKKTINRYWESTIIKAMRDKAALKNVRNLQDGLNDIEDFLRLEAGIDPVAANILNKVYDDTETTEANYEKSKTEAVTKYKKHFENIQELFKVLYVLALAIGIIVVYIKIQGGKEVFETITTWGIAYLLVFILLIAANAFFTAYLG